MADVSAPPTMTMAGIAFFQEEERTNRFRQLHDMLAEAVDTVGARSAILQIEQAHRDKLSTYGLFVGVPEESQLHESASEALAMFEQQRHRMEHARRVDNFMCYLSGILSEIFCICPKAMNAYSSKQFGIETILRHSDYPSLLAAIAQEIIHALSYKGICGITEAFKKHGLDLFDEEETQTGAVEAVAIRNIIVHNRTVINDIFLSLVPKTIATTNLPDGSSFRKRGYSLPLNMAKGQTFELDDIQVGNYARLLWRVVLRFDRLATKKFRLSNLSVPQDCLAIVYYSDGQVRDALALPSSVLGFLPKTEIE